MVRAILLALLLACAPALAADEPASFAQFRKNFEARVIQDGGDPARCKYEVGEVFDGKVFGDTFAGALDGTKLYPLTISCDHKPLRCVVIAYADEPMFVQQLSECVPNPDYRPTTRS
jgi:hypothetical protein